MSNEKQKENSFEHFKKLLESKNTSIPKTYEASVHGIMNNWTDREWELFKTIKPFDLEENMIIYFDNWLHYNINDEDRVHLDLRGN